MAEIVNDGNIEETLKTEKLVVLDAFADWCGPCKVIGPIIDELHKENPDVFIGKVDVDNNPQISGRFGIRSIPTIIFIKNGVVVDKFVGARPKTEIIKMIEANK
jgi:thioredoxin 1